MIFSALLSGGLFYSLYSFFDSNPSIFYKKDKKELKSKLITPVTLAAAFAAFVFVISVYGGVDEYFSYYVFGSETRPAVAPYTATPSTNYNSHTYYKGSGSAFDEDALLNPYNY